MSIAIASRKAKGRKLQKWVVNKIADMLNTIACKDCDLESRPMGQEGVDVILRGKYKAIFPFSVECKWQEAWSVPAWIRQAKENIMDNTSWLLFCKRSREDPIVVLDADDFFRIYIKSLYGGELMAEILIENIMHLLLKEGNKIQTSTDLLDIFKKDAWGFEDLHLIENTLLDMERDGYIITKKEGVFEAERFFIVRINKDKMKNFLGWKD